MCHRDLYLEQETKYGYQNRYNNGGPLARSSCQVGPEEEPGRLARGSRDITVWRQLAPTSHTVHQSSWWVGPPYPPWGSHSGLLYGTRSSLLLL